MKKTRYFSLISIIIFSFIILVIYILLYNFVVYTKAFNSAKKLNEFYSKESVRIKIYGYSLKDEQNTISARFSIIDKQGSEISIIERSWTGSYLSCEFSIINLNNSLFVFPSNMYGKNNIIEKSKLLTKGTKLEKYYTEDNECLLAGNVYNKKQKKYLYNISRLVNPNFPIINFGFTKKVYVDLSNCKVGKYYSINSDSAGLFYISEL